MIAVLFEFFLVGVTGVLSLYPALIVFSAWCFPGLSGLLFNSEWSSSAFAVGVAVCYVFGLVFHDLARRLFDGLEVKIMMEVLKESNVIAGLDGLNSRKKKSVVRHKYREMRHAVYAASKDSSSVLKEQDQLLRITRGVVFPLFLATILWSIYLYIIRSHHSFLVLGVLPQHMVAGLEYVVVIICFLLFVGLCFALKKRLEDYYNNTISAYEAVTKMNDQALNKDKHQKAGRRFYGPRRVF